MSQRDYSRQVAKRQRIRKATLIVGVDIGKAFNAVGFMDKEGNVLGNCVKLYNNREGFEEFINQSTLDIFLRRGSYASWSFLQSLPRKLVSMAIQVTGRKMVAENKKGVTA